MSGGDNIANSADAMAYLANALATTQAGARAVTEHWPAGGPPNHVREALDALDAAMYRVLEVLWPEGGAFPVPEEIQ